MSVETTTLGQAATTTHYLRRRRSANSARAYSYRKEWKASPVIQLTPGHDTITGVIIGVRTLSNGECSFGEDGTNYQPDREGHFAAYLIAYDLRRKPVLALPEHVTTKEN